VGATAPAGPTEHKTVISKGKKRKQRRARLRAAREQGAAATRVDDMQTEEEVKVSCGATPGDISGAKSAGGPGVGLGGGFGKGSVDNVATTPSLDKKPRTDTEWGRSFAEALVRGPMGDWAKAPPSYPAASAMAVDNPAPQAVKRESPKKSPLTSGDVLFSGGGAVPSPFTASRGFSDLMRNVNVGSFTFGLPTADSSKSANCELCNRSGCLGVCGFGKTVVGSRQVKKVMSKMGK